MTVVWATAIPEFEVDIDIEENGVKVEFHSEAWSSSVEAWWDGGPQHQITEEPEEPDDS